MTAEVRYWGPFSLRAEEITSRAILRADSLGMEHYGPYRKRLHRMMVMECSTLPLRLK